MKPLLVLAAALPALAAAQPGDPLRFTLRPELLELSNCVAQPGAVPLRLATNANLEIVDWSAAASTNRQPGEFFIRFTNPTPVGSVILYGAEEAYFQSSNSWKRIDAGPEAGRKLQFLPLPAGTVPEAIKLVVSPAALSAAGGKPALFQATLPFATLVPIRLANTAPDAMVSASGLPEGSAQSLVDGVVDAKRSLPLPAWVALTWNAPRTFRGIAVYRGSEEQGWSGGAVEAFTGTGEPRGARGSNDWRVIRGRSTMPGQFRGNELFVCPPTTTRAVRLISTNTLERAGLGEIAVLRDLGTEPWPAGKVLVPVEKSLTVPRVAPNRITVDGDVNDWPAARTNGFALAFDETRLYLLYQALGDAARFANAGTNLHELFHTGDAVDVMLQTRPGLDARRAAPGPGDVRFLFSTFQDRAVCVLYDFHADDLLVLPVSFRSAARTVECDKVAELKDARVELRRTPSALTLEASVPLKSIRLDPTALKQTRGDFGRIFATPPRRACWANENPAPPGNLAAGAEIHPATWGVLRFGE